MFGKATGSQALNISMELHAGSFPVATHVRYSVGNLTACAMSRRHLLAVGMLSAGYRDHHYH